MSGVKQIESRPLTNAILATLQDHPDGLSTAAVAHLSGVSREQCKARLRTMTGAGGVQYFGGRTRLGRWTLSCNSLRTQAVVTAEIQAMRSDRKEAKRARNRLAKIKRAERVANSEQPIVQRVVKASKVEPLRKLGPNSVWQLAA